MKNEKAKAERAQFIAQEINKHAEKNDENCKRFLSLQQELKASFEKDNKNKAKQQRLLSQIMIEFSKICLNYQEISERFFAGNGPEDIAAAIEELLCSTGPINELLQALGADFLEETRISFLESLKEPEPEEPEPEPDTPQL